MGEGSDQTSGPAPGLQRGRRVRLAARSLDPASIRAQSAAVEKEKQPLATAKLRGHIRVHPGPRPAGHHSPAELRETLSMAAGTAA